MRYTYIYSSPLLLLHECMFLYQEGGKSWLHPTQLIKYGFTACFTADTYSSKSCLVNRREREKERERKEQKPGCPTNPFAILEHQNTSINVFELLKVCLSLDSVALKWWKGRRVLLTVRNNNRLVGRRARKLEALIDRDRPCDKKGQVLFFLLLIVLYFRFISL